MLKKAGKKAFKNLKMPEHPGFNNDFSNFENLFFLSPTPNFRIVVIGYAIL